MPRRFLYWKRSVMATATGVHNKVSCRTEDWKYWCGISRWKKRRGTWEAALYRPQRFAAAAEVSEFCSYCGYSCVLLFEKLASGESR